MAMMRVSLLVHRRMSASVLRNWSTLSCSIFMHIQRPSFLTRMEEQKGRAVYNCHLKDRSVIISHHLSHHPGSNISVQCWRCNSEVAVSTQFCGKCCSLQPLDHRLNYFEILGTKKTFNVNTEALKKAFRKLQTRFHPDKFSLKHEREQQFAMEYSSAINKSYRCVLHPVERALYLLELEGQPLHEGQLHMDPEFLMEIMEVNEELEAADSKDTVQTIGQRNQQILDGLLSEADAAFSANDIETARKIVAKIKYYNNIYEKVRKYEREHGIIDD